MSYDVFLVSGVADRDIAKLVVRRLRSLKFKVAFNQNQTDETFDPKDARDATNSQSVLVLWSENAVKSDWVRAAASVGNSRPGTLVQAAIDKTIPYEPFRQEKRYSIEGMTSRKTPEGFYQLVEELGRREGRTNLREWLNFGSKDDDLRADWLAAHPNDPLAVDARKKREKDLGIKPAPAREAIGAAVLAAASLKTNGTKANVAPVAAPVATAQPNPLEELGAGWGAIVAVSVAVVGMLVLAWAFRSEASPELAATSHAIANSRMAAASSCPVGTVPRSLLTVLEAGPIIDDTQPQIIDDTSEPDGAE
ncbi:hypothetical protein K1X12_12580 [Hyphomonas sp. WL0036]|uniref:hypothetical protein n=1 Tax=Hyphomonas sediminis TaxID=2866160 RepID=UPI001C812BCC|nr:hypothetical protein [Hyphomonas sediminis]MBY9067740.1 hypothetical protein [Hyphomonas sediminis]